MIKFSNFGQISSWKIGVTCSLRLEKVTICDAWFTTFWIRFRWPSLHPPHTARQYMMWGKTSASTMRFLTPVGSFLENLVNPARVAYDLRIIMETWSSHRSSGSRVTPTPSCYWSVALVRLLSHSSVALVFSFWQSKNHHLSFGRIHFQTVLVVPVLNRGQHVS